MDPYPLSQIFKPLIPAVCYHAIRHIGYLEPERAILTYSKEGCTQSGNRYINNSFDCNQSTELEVSSGGPVVLRVATSKRQQTNRRISEPAGMALS
jgi:hypothetical protein